ncbi:TolB family protein [Kitasatospora sp. NPDC092039]|uniref:TolB family protein n=1 Tax=Kitasatospora sp. NPDC092039 TaxID=3364086 RepID=UPI0037FA97C9
MIRIRRPLRTACALAAAALAAAVAAPAQAAPADTGPAVRPGARTERVSVGPGHAQATGASQADGLSADGRFAVFTSEAADLVPGDTNGTSDVFVRDLWTGRTERVDTGPDGAQADGASYQAAISGDGRYVAFSSTATNLAPDANRGSEDVYVHDRRTGETRLVSVGRTGVPQTGKLSGVPSISWDGRYVAYQSNRGDLAPGTVTWFGGNIYVTDRWTGDTRLVSIGADGREADASSSAPEISADGNTVVFISKATNLLDPGQAGGLSPEAVAELRAGSDQEFTADSSRPSARPDPRADALPDSRPVILPDPRPEIRKPRTYPLYVRDLRTGRTSLASPDADGGYRGVVSPSVSPDGRYAVYSSWVLHGDSQWDRHFEVYVRDLARGTETLVSSGLPGTTTTLSSYGGRITADGRWVLFSSEAANLVPGDTNGAEDVFRHDLWTGRTERVSLAGDGSQSTGPSHSPFPGAFGTTVVFASADGTLVPGDTNGVEDVFLRRLPLF